MASRRAFLTGLCVGVVGAGSCSVFGDDQPGRQVPADWTPAPGEWATGTYDYAGTLANTAAEPPTEEPSEVWAVTPGPDEDTQGGVVVADGTVFHGEAGALTAYDGTDGTERWERDTPYGYTTWYVDGRLYDRADRDLAALSLDGETIWTAEAVAAHRLFEREGYVYLSTLWGGFQWYDADTGDRIGDLDAAVVGMASAGDSVYTAGPEGVAAYDFADDGAPEERWRAGDVLTTEWQQEPRDADDEPTAPLPAVVAVADDTVHLLERPRGLQGDEARLMLLDADDGEVIGTVAFDRWVNGPVVDDDVYLHAATVGEDWRDRADGELLAYDGTDQRWATDVEASYGFFKAGSLLVVSRGDVDGGNHSTTALDATDGEPMWTYDGASALAAVGETIYGTSRGPEESVRLVALRE